MPDMRSPDEDDPKEIEPGTVEVVATSESDDPDATYPVDRLKARINKSLGDRPVMVYLVLLAGAATLILLLAIVWISATGNNPEERPICTAISADEAATAIMNNQVKKINVLVDGDDPLQSLTGLVLEYVDGTCRQPAQGADVRNDLYRILGVVELYNTFGEQRVRLHYQRQEIQDELLFTSTPTPSPTIEPTVTETPSPTPTETETVEPTPTEIASPTPSAPAATERALVASPMATATTGFTSSPTPTVTPTP